MIKDMVSAQGAKTWGLAIGKFRLASTKYTPNAARINKINHFLSGSKSDLKRMIKPK